MSTPDADALLAAVLADPADPLRRLVLADYLDDAGGPGPAAWAEYLRLRAAAADEPSPLRREVLRQAAAEVAPRVAAGLALPASSFLADPTHLLDLLPVDRFTLRLDGFTPRRIVPDAALCRAHRGLPLATGTPQPVVGQIDQTTDADRTFWRHQFGAALFVRVPTEEFEPALQRVYAPRALVPYRPAATVEVRPATLDEQLGTASAEVMRRWVEQLVDQARERGASAVDITAYESHYWVRRLESGKSLRWHQVGVPLGRELVRAARALPARRLGVRVRPRNSSSGDGVRIQLLNLPAPPGVRGSQEPGT